MLRKSIIILSILFLSVSCMNITDAGGDTGSTGSTGTTGTSGTTGSTDSVPPDVDYPDISVAGISSSSVALSWQAANDTNTHFTDLEYLVCYSTSEADINSIYKATNYGTVWGTWTANNLSATVSGLNDGTTYYFTVLVRDEANNISPYNIVHTNTTELGVVYWTDYLTDTMAGSMAWANLSGEVQNRFTETGSTFYQLAHNETGSKIYMICQISSGAYIIRSVTYAGGSSTTLVTVPSPDEIKAVAIDANNSYLFWAEYYYSDSYALLYRSDLSGGSMTLIYSNTNAITALAVDDSGYLYRLENDAMAMGGSIYRCWNDGTSETLVKNFTSGTVNALAAYGGYVYCSVEDATYSIVRTHTNSDPGSSFNTTDGYSVAAISAFKGKIYWSEYNYSDTARIRRADPDGSNPQIIVSGLSNQIYGLLAIP